MCKANIKLIVGLGNVGAKYEHTRHNMGVDLLEKLADKYHLQLNLESKFFGLTARGNIKDNDVRLLFPTTYMNESGRAVAAMCNFYRIAADEVLVLHDEMDLNPGALRLKFGGGLAGHNGLRSISACLGGSLNFYRLRIGIGKASTRDTGIFELSRPSVEESCISNQAIDHAIAGIELILTDKVAKATSYINSFK